jgi:hypothetical protein
MKRLLSQVLRGAAAGAAGTTALNAVTYLDMAVRARPSSSTPSETVERMSERVGVSVPGDGESRRNRVDGLGPLLGVLTGVGTGAALAAARAVGLRAGTLATSALAAAFAAVAADMPMAALSVTDPRDWSPSEWLTDLIPHAAYGAVTAATLELLDQPSR